MEKHAVPQEKTVGQSEIQKQDRHEAKTRWGDGKIKITRFLVNDRNRNEKYVFKTGDEVIFRIEYEAVE